MTANDFIITAKRPIDCSSSELENFAMLVHEGGEVGTAGLEDRIGAAQILVFAYAGDELAAISALKRPTERYRASVFRKARATLNVKSFGIELGWVYVKPKYQGRGLSRQLVSLAIERAHGEPLFATSRANNSRMHSSLAKYGFVKNGSEYASAERSEKLVLFIRQPRSS